MERLASELPSFEPEPEYLLDFARQAGGEPPATSAEYRRFFWDGMACGNAIVLEKKSADCDETFFGGVLFQTVLGRTIRIAMAVRAILDSDGRLLSYETLQRVGEDSKRTRALFRAEDTLWIETEEGATRSEKEVAFSRRALTTEAEIRKYFEAGGLAAGTSFRSVSWDCFAEKVDSKEVVLGPLEVIDVLGKRTDVRSLSSNCVEPGCDLRELSYVDEHFKTVVGKSHGHSPVFSISSVRCTREEALAPFNVPSHASLPQLVVQEELQQKCDRISACWGADIILKSTRSDGLLPHFPETDQQEVRWGPRGQATIVTRQLQAKAGEPRWPEEVQDAAARRFLLPSKHVQSDDPGILALAREATRRSQGSCDAVIDIEYFVSTYLERDRSARYLSAAEAMTVKRGDCTEFSALVAALCRASGIPARIVEGVVYDDQEHTFRPHEWVEAYQAGRWIGLDAALRGYTVDRIALAIGCGLSEGGDCGNGWMALENLQIVDVRLHDRE